MTSLEILIMLCWGATVAALYLQGYLADCRIKQLHQQKRDLFEALGAVVKGEAEMTYDEKEQELHIEKTGNPPTGFINFNNHKEN